MIARLFKSHRPAAALGLGCFLLLFFFSPPAFGSSKGAMEIGLSSHYAWPQQDVADLSPGLDYGAVFHYWLTRTTSVLVGLETVTFECPLKVDGRSKRLLFQAVMLELGVRYRPEVDFIFKPYLEAGVGYQFWSTDPSPSFLDSRSGNSLAYFAGLGLEREFAGRFTWGLNLRYHYFPMRENLEREVFTNPDGSYLVEKDAIREVVFVSAGFELTWRFR